LVTKSLSDTPNPWLKYPTNIGYKGAVAVQNAYTESLIVRCTLTASIELAVPAVGDNLIYITLGTANGIPDISNTLNMESVSVINFAVDEFMPKTVTCQLTAFLNPNSAADGSGSIIPYWWTNATNLTPVTLVWRLCTLHTEVLRCGQPILTGAIAPPPGGG
jgi:hypothetical protein